MADNTQLNANTTDGDKLATAEVSFSDETVKCEIVGIGLISGSAESYVLNLGSAGAGSVGVGVQRMTLASDDPAVASLGIMDDWDDGADHCEIVDANTAILGTTTYSEATTKGPVVGAVRNDVLAPLADTDNEIAPLQVDELGALWTTRAPNIVDDGNSRSTILTSGQTFTGTGIDVLHFAGVTCNLFADQDGAADGMRFEFSPDNSNWTTDHQHDYIANTDRQFQFTAKAQFFRVVFVNGGVTQGALRIQTVLHRTTVPSATIHRLDSELAPDRSASVVKSALMARAAGVGNFTPINSTSAGNLKVAVEEFDTALPAGDNNIGNVDIVTFPAGNLGQQAMAASLSITPANNITDATYIGDIKFGESLPTGSNAIGKLAANSGVDIGDVDVTSIVPGVAATNLGKARASALGATDTGVMSLAVRNDDLADLAGADGDYTPVQVDSNGAAYVNQAAAENKSASGVAVGGAPGTDDIIAAVPGKKILVTAMALTATSTTTNNIFLDNADNDLWHNTGNPFPISTDADADTSPGIVLNYNPAGWFKTDTVNEAVTLNTSAAQDIAWTISWIETD